MPWDFVSTNTSEECCFLLLMLLVPTERPKSSIIGLLNILGVLGFITGKQRSDGCGNTGNFSSESRAENIQL